MSVDPYLAAVGRYLGGWPGAYLSVDIETNGMVVDDPCVLPVSVGWCLVDGGEVVLNDEVVLDWFLELEGEDAQDFAVRLARTAESMESKGLRYPFTPRHLEEHGVPPRDAIDLVTTRLAEAAAGGLPIVGHNLYSFDRPILERSARDWTGRSLVIPAVGVIDTMCIERGKQKKQVVYPSGTRQSWYEKLARGPEKCSLQGHCAAAYGFTVDPDQAHGAGYDSLLVHHLLEGMKERSR